MARPALSLADCAPRAPSLAIAVLLALLLLRHRPRAHALAPDAEMFARLPACVRGLRGRGDDEAPWLAVYGDSLSRIVFFDTAEALNGSAPAAPNHVHPGHHANYSVDCTVVEARPPVRRLKCGGFAFDWWWPADESAARGFGNVRTARLPEGGNDAAPAATAREHARLSFRMKTFAWEPEYDQAWLRALRRAPRLPDALLLSFGIWDMQYPLNNEPANGLSSFVNALRRFLNALERALAAEPTRARDDDDDDGHGAAHGGERDGTADGTARRRPRLFWLSVTAVADERLPAWKRPRMSASLARRYNELALPELHRHGVQYIDTYTSGAAHPELSLDGVHFGGAMSRSHAELFWRALCEQDGATQRSVG